MTPPLRVVHVIAGIDQRLGGPSIALRGLAAAQVRAGLAVSAVSTWVGAPPDEEARALRQAGVDVALVGPARTPLQWHPGIDAALRRALGAADVAHVHGLWEQIQHRAAVDARARGIPYLFRPCGMLDPWSLAQHPVRKRLFLALRVRRDLNRAAALHFTSEAESTVTLRLGLAPSRIVAPNGVDLDEFSPLPPRGSFRRRHPAVADRPCVLFLGRLHPKKGLDLLLPAFAAAGRDDAALVVAGPGDDDYRRRLERRALDLGIAERTLFTGMLRGHERVAALADADLFVLPSRQENFGVAVVEALAAGCPVLVSDRVGIHAAIADAGVGGVVSLDVEAIAHALRRWLGDADLRTAAADRARPFALAEFDWRTIALRWCSLYEDIAASSD